MAGQLYIQVIYNYNAYLGHPQYIYIMLLAKIRYNKYLSIKLLESSTLPTTQSHRIQKQAGGTLVALASALEQGQPVANAWGERSITVVIKMYNFQLQHNHVVHI